MLFFLATPRRTNPIVTLVAVLLAVPLLTHSANSVNFRVAGANGEINSDEFRGQVLYVDFWASWCAPCLKSFPWMNEMQAKYADQGLKIIAINMDKKKSAADDFLQSTAARFLIGYDPDGKLAADFAVIGMPSSYLIDREGNLISSHIGFRKKDLEKYEAAILEALRQ